MANFFEKNIIFLFMRFAIFCFFMQIFGVNYCCKSKFMKNKICTNTSFSSLQKFLHSNFWQNKSGLHCHWPSQLSFFPLLEIVTFPIPLIIFNSLTFSKSLFCYSSILFFHLFVKLWKCSYHPSTRYWLNSLWEPICMLLPHQSHSFTISNACLPTSTSSWRWKQVDIYSYFLNTIALIIKWMQE